jgi:hypothetical protein
MNTETCPFCFCGAVGSVPLSVDRPIFNFQKINTSFVRLPFLLIRVGISEKTDFQSLSFLRREGKSKSCKT